MKESLFNNFKVKIGDINSFDPLDPGKIKKYFIGLLKEDFLVAAGHNVQEDFLFFSPLKNVSYLKLFRKRIFWLLAGALILSILSLFVNNFYLSVSFCSGTLVLLIIYFSYTPVGIEIGLDRGMHIEIFIKKQDIKKARKFIETLLLRERQIHTHDKEKVAFSIREKEKLSRECTDAEKRWKEVRHIVNDLLSGGQFRKAQNFLREYLREAPRDWRAWNELGRAYFMQNNREKAVECFKKSLEFYPNYAPAIYNLGVTYEKMGRFKDALQCYEKYLQINPDAEDAQIIRFAIDDIRLRENF